MTTQPTAEEVRPSTDEKWWKRAVVYQVYPKSFADSNGDGIGDLAGTIARLDYLQTLGIDVIWLSPIYVSPQRDNGYDIADYRGIDPVFGDLDTFDELIAEGAKRGIRILMDLVVNHTSDQHAWFVDARSARDAAHRDWYIWRSARPGTIGGQPGAEPNDWQSFFGGSAWQWDERTGQYYLHLFDVSQPDLNWENPAVRNAVYEMMTWWLDRGVGGFRMDVINLISKNQDDLVCAGPAPLPICGPRFHEYMKEMHERVFTPLKREYLTVGESLGISLEDAVLATDDRRKELDMVFQFEHMEVDKVGDAKWEIGKLPLPALKASLARWQHGMGEHGWNSLYWDNHDRPRIVSRWGSSDPLTRERSAKMLALVLHMHRGTPYIYQGEELAMTNAPFASIDEVRDVEAINAYREARGRGLDDDEALAYISRVNRDNARTPMQWDAGVGAGFTTGEPWIVINPNHREINAAAQVDDPQSVFTFYRELVALRHSSDVVALGDYRLLLPEHEQVFAFVRQFNDETLLVLANFSDVAVDVTDELAPEWRAEATAVLLGTDRVPGERLARFDLRPWEGYALRVN